MVSDQDFLVGVKLSDSPKNENIWDRIKKIQKAGICLNCERHHWKNKDIKLCDKCYRTCSREKCIHCKEEFSNHKYCKKAETIYKRIVCLNCARNIATYNLDAKLCRFCNCWSSWRETSECDRCYKLLEKYGNPTNCESCNKNCAFNRGEESRNKVSGLKLCYLCTYDFKKNDYYNKRRLNISHSSLNSSHSSVTVDSKGNFGPDSERYKIQSDTENELLKKRVQELEAELSELKESYNQLLSKQS